MMDFLRFVFQTILEDCMTDVTAFGEDLDRELRKFLPPFLLLVIVGLLLWFVCGMAP